MPTSCEHVTAHLMELLYGEMPPDERASIDGHLANCARCRAELASFQRTRTLARQALDDAPPARVRNGILQAAAAAAAQAGASQARPPKRSSWWNWLRGRWTLPTLATVGAVAVFVLGSRLFLDPANTYDRGRGGLSTPPSKPAQTDRREDTTPPSGRAMDVPSPPPSNVPENPSGEPPPTYRRHVKAPAKLKAADAPGQRAGHDDFAPPPPPRPLAAPAAEVTRPPAAAQRKPAATLDRAADSSAGSAEERATEDGVAASRAAASSPAPRGSAVPPAAPAPAPRRAAAAPVAPAPTAGRREETLRARADRLFSEGLWTEAADAYRALLRSEPGSPEADRWRQRLAAALRADAEGTAPGAPTKRPGRPAANEPPR